ncbi:hypothetical protein [Pseudooceanicola nanhaiensis]|uniref:hypothetical protein n=1 Tax=Pseudooceanicola nanhaiensis TaxID=375761 RepID=UPI003516170E
MYYVNVPRMTSEERELGRRGPAVCRTANIEVIDVAVDGVEIASRRLVHEHRSPELHLYIRSSNGLLQYHLEDGSEKWSCSPSREDYNTHVTEADAHAFVKCTIPAVVLLPKHFPETHLPETGQENLGAEDRLLLAEAFEAPLPPVHEGFARGLAVIANLIREARANDFAKREEKARRKRMKRQFDSLPAGTILLNQGFDNRIAIVSDERGKNTLRSLDIHCARFGAWKVDFTIHNLEHYSLFSGPRSRELDRGLLSAHQLMTALSQAKRLGPTCPDLLM